MATPVGSGARGVGIALERDAEQYTEKPLSTDAERGKRSLWLQDYLSRTMRRVMRVWPSHRSAYTYTPLAAGRPTMSRPSHVTVC